MDTRDLFYPQIVVKIGKYVFTEGVGIEIYSARASRTDWARIRFTKELPAEIEVNAMDEAAILLGYNGVLDCVFSGYADAPFASSSGANEIVLKDAAIKLANTIISETFTDATPQEIIRYILAKSDIDSAELLDNEFQTLHRVGIYHRSGLYAIDDVHAAWGISYPAFFRYGTFYWGKAPAQDDLYTFEYGVNIISLSKINGIWELVTLSAPFVRHSDQIAIEHPMISGKFTVLSVAFITNEDGFVRTTIRFS